MSEAESPFRERLAVLWILLTVGVFLLFGFIVQLRQFRTPPHGFRAEAKQYIKALSVAIDAYGVEFGSVPYGSNAEVMRALFGDNPRKIVFFQSVPSHSSHVSGRGKLIDPWGMPYRIDTTGPTGVRIYSCRPNKRDENGAEESDDVAGLLLMPSG